MTTAGVVDAYGVVVYEGGVNEYDNDFIDHPADEADFDTNESVIDVGQFGVTSYDQNAPIIGQPIAKMRDTDTYQGIEPTLFVQWNEP